MEKTKSENSTVPITDKIQPILNQMAAALSLYPTDSLLIKSIPVIISVFNELITFTDGKIVEERLCQLEEGIQNMGIELEEFKQNVENLDEHNQFVLRRHVKDYCLSALPETIEMRILSMVEFVMAEEHDFAEEICEIVSELNRTDLEVLTKIYAITTDEELNEKRKKEAQDKISNSSGKYRDRVYYLSRRTIMWEDFMNIKRDDRVITFSDSLNYHLVNSDGKDNYQIAMYSRSLLKLQNLGVIDMDAQAVLGASPINNVCQFHLTVFGVKLMQYVSILLNEVLST